MTQPDPWRFGRRGSGCAACAAAFVPGKEAVSAIYEAGAAPDSAGASAQPTGTQDAAPAGGFERRDFCGPCFQDAQRRGGPFSWWSAVVPEPEKRKAVFDLGVAREFFQRLLRDDDPARASLRYLLALMLLRKRAVVLVGQEAVDGADVMTVRVPPDDESVHEVRCVELDQAETERLRDELGRLFDM